MFGQVLRETRHSRRLSQLELALNAEISQRHLSFLESGRSQPSREMVLQIAGALDLPLRERNRLLLSAGFAAVFPQRSLGSADMRPVRQALELMLQHHEPYPAIVVDRAWNLQMGNAAVPRVFSLIGDLNEVWKRVCPDGVHNVLKLTFHPQGLRPFLRNFAEIAPALIARTQREALEHPAVAEVLETILRYPDLPARWRAAEALPEPAPVLPMDVEAHGVRLQLFSTITTFGTPLDVTADELRVESFFPADPATEALLRKMGSS